MKYYDPGCRKEKTSLQQSSLQISRLMNDSASNIDDFINTVRFNSTLSTAIIDTVNRDYSGFCVDIDCIAQAVRMLGIGQLHSLVNHLSESGQRTDYRELNADFADDADSSEFKWAG